MQICHDTQRRRITRTMPSYKLTYFNVRGRAEVTRLALAVAKVKYEDERLDSNAWQKMKPNTLTGQLPILVADGKEISQSNAILRHIAREHGMYGKGNKENTEVDVVIETANDLIDKKIKVFFEKDESKKAELMKEFVDDTVPLFVKISSALLGKKEWMVGSKVTVADLTVYNVLESIVTMALDKFGKDIFDGYDNMKQHANRVKSIPEMKKWLETRPKTDF
ncbi:hematopoietic prostaglandin D synthase-like [Pecten maximus]|uniref:hematopoietic prostaglandin D synthase-like n=1 Tax=Pecten maximus TaxID=6579 RepID=UPI0014581995|nr:hematopoietic prostaglandin D synthase-like [Pecten maximus]